MNAIFGWGLVLVAALAGWFNYGWQGVFVVATATVFWLLLQFNRAIKVMKNAGHAPMGSVASAVMLNAKLKQGMSMLQVVTLTRSLGRQAHNAIDASANTWVWADEGGAAVAVVMSGSGVVRWQLTRTVEIDTQSPQPGP
jgi:hypothetical protein